jgi:hypothetical protein
MRLCTTVGVTASEIPCIVCRSVKNVSILELSAYTHNLIIEPVFNTLDSALTVLIAASVHTHSEYIKHKYNVAHITMSAY